MNERLKNTEDTGGEGVEKYQYKEVYDSGFGDDDQKRMNSLGREAENIDKIQKEKDKEQKEILELREVIKKAAQDNAQELTDKVQKMFVAAKDSMESNSRELTQKSMEELKCDLTKLIGELSVPMGEIKGFLVQEGRDKEMEEIQNIIAESLGRLKEVLDVQSERVDKLERKTKDTIKNIVEKVVGVEISNQGERIVETNIALLYEEFREAQRVEVLLSKGDYAVLEEKISSFFAGKGVERENLVIRMDRNIKRGSFLILTDKGNFDSNIDEKIKLIIDSML